MRRRTCSSASRSCWNRKRQFQTLDHIERFKQFDLLFEIQVRRVTGGVRQGSGMGDRSHKTAEPAVVAAKFEDLLNHGAILAFQFVRYRRRRNDVRTFFDIDAEPAIRLRLSRTGHSSMETLKRHRISTSRQLDAFRHFRDHSNLGVGVAVPRHQENLFVVAGIERQRDRHPRENHRVIQRNQCKSCHETNDMHIVDVVNY